MTGIQLKNEFLVRNGFKHAEFSKRNLVKLMNLEGEVRELRYTLSTLNKTINEFQLLCKSFFSFLFLVEANACGM